MKQIGHRTAPPLRLQAGTAPLIEGARFNEALAALGPAGIMPKGVYRFRTHEQANQHQAKWLAHGMADLALEVLQTH
jgi:hypothetical protein